MLPREVSGAIKIEAARARIVWARGNTSHLTVRPEVSKGIPGFDTSARTDWVPTEKRWDVQAFSILNLAVEVLFCSSYRAGV
jgi:hypothetical protein